MWVFKEGFCLGLCFQRRTPQQVRICLLLLCLARKRQWVWKTPSKYIQLLSGVVIFLESKEIQCLFWTQTKGWESGVRRQRVFLRHGLLALCCYFHLSELCLKKQMDGMQKSGVNENSLWRFSCWLHAEIRVLGSKASCFL